MGNLDSAMRNLNQKSVDNLEPLKSNNLPIIFVLGGPGSGKGEQHPVGYNSEGDAILSQYWLPQGTQCEKIAEKYGFLHVSSGNLLQEEAGKDSARGVMIKQLLSDGKNIPSNVIVDLIKEKMKNSLSTAQGFVFDGFPREKIQAKIFDREIRTPDLVIYLKIDERLLKERLQGRAVTSGRITDTENNIQLRIKLFLREYKPILKHYDKKLTTINAERDIQDVFNDVCNVIDKNITFIKVDKET